MDKFLQFWLDPDATLVARNCHDAADERVLPVSHRLVNEPGESDIAAMAALPVAIRADMERFYGTHASASLFVVAESAGIELVAPGEWVELTEEIGEWWSDALDELEPRQRDNFEGVLAFGHIGCASTYFVVFLDGELRGQVGLCTGPGLELWPICANFGAFLDAIPTRAIEWIQGDVRYEDGVSGEQYFPVVYCPHGRIPTPRRVVQLRLESEGSSAIARFECDESTEDEVELAAPSGKVFSVVVELYENDEASISIADDERTLQYIRGFGEMKFLAVLGGGDRVSGEVVGRVG